MFLQMLFPTAPDRMSIKAIRGILLPAILSLVAIVVPGGSLPGDGATVLSVEAGQLTQPLQETSLRLDAPSPSETRIGEPVTASGSLSTSGDVLEGETVVLTFLSPENDSLQKTTVTDSLGRFFCDFAPSSVGNWSVIANYQGNDSHSPASADPQNFDVIQAETFLTADLSAVSIVTGTSFSLRGALRARSYLQPGERLLADREVSLSLYDPSGTFAGSTTEITTETGRYSFANVVLPLGGKWTLLLQFNGDNNLEPCSQDLTVRARPSAGYAIIVAGKVTGESGLDSHNKTTDRAYRRFKERGFTDEDILYFRYNTPSDPNVIADEQPTQHGIRDAITTWARDNMNASNGPLYILFVNHGNTEKFYVDPSAPEFQDRIIDPVQLDDWISQLENGLVGEAADQEIVFIYGACYSGSFIPALSHPDKERIVITSADPNEQSFKGPTEEDGVRDGEFFVTQLFTALSRGLNLKRSFEVATAVVEAYTSNPSGNGGVSDSPYADDAAQHPLLDDNGDGSGSNDALSKYPGNDGAVSAGIILGYQYTLAEPVRFTSVSPAKHLAPGDPDPILEAKVTDADNVSEIWVAIKPPDFDLGRPTPGVSEQRELGAPQLGFDSQPTAGTFNLSNFDKGGFSGFNAPGRYEILYFVKDSHTDSISIVKRSFVYRLDGSDVPPQSFGLVSPGDGSMQNTVLFLDWEDSLDPDDQKVSYTVEISTDGSFAAPEFVLEGIDGSGAMIDESVGLSDLTTYSWRVIAVDESGNRTFSSETRSFETNDTNAWGNYNILTAIVRNLNNPATWPPDSSIEIQPYVGKIYNHYYSAMLPLGSYSVDSEAPQFSQEHDDAEVVEEYPTTVLHDLGPDPGTVGGVAENSATSSPLRGATVRLKVTTGIHAGTEFSCCSDDDGGFHFPDLFAAVDYQLTVEKNFYTSYQTAFHLAAAENRDFGSVQIGFDDMDGDDLPDAFEQLIVDAEPDDEIDDVWDVLGTDDFDGDGMTNAAEYTASTDPASSESTLKIVALCALGNGDVTITWASRSGVYYDVWYTDGLATWSIADGPIPSSGDESTSWTDDGSCTVPPPLAGKRFYRVEIY